MIWDYALSGYLIKIRSEKLAPPTRKSGQARFNLLQVSRQIYQETAPLPFALSTLSFPSLVEFRRYAVSGRLKRVQDIHVGGLLYNLNSTGKCDHWIPLTKMPSLQSLHITLCGLGRWDGEQERQEAEESLIEHLEGRRTKRPRLELAANRRSEADNLQEIELNLHNVALFQTWLDGWRESEAAHLGL